MRKPRFIIPGVACLVLLNFAGIADAQYNAGLYKNGQLIDTFAAAAPATNAAPRPLSAKVAGSAAPVTAVAPVVSADAQARNQVFAESAMLGIQIRDTLRQIQNPVLKAYTLQQAQPERGLADLLQQLTTKQTEVRAAFDSIAVRLVELKMPPEILQRHFDAVAANEAGFAAFTSAVNDVLSGKPGAVDAALKLLNQIKLREEPDLTRRSPTHQPMPILSVPQLTHEEADALLNSQPKAAAAAMARTALGSIKANLSPPATNDLAETPDVQLTPAIRAKAASLGNSAEAIYDFVRNKVKFQPYLGSRKGAAFTLQQMAGNDTDQASLLLALLRAANIPCRYVRGTVEMTPDQAKSWLGVDDTWTAGAILTTAGLNGVNVVNGTNVIAVRCTRVWVEAYVPYSNYRGVPNDDTGKTWIPLDPAFKQTSVAPGEDVLTAMGYNNDAFLANYISTYNSNSPIETLQLNIQSWLNTNRPGTNLADIERTISTQPLNLGLLPASLPINSLTAGDGFPSLADTNRFKIRIYLHNGGTSLIDYTTNLSQLAGHKVTISYVGATTNDQAVIDAHGGIYQTPPYLVNVKPVLKLDGNPVATAANSIGMGYQHESDMYFTQPAGDQNVQPVIYNTIFAGNSQAIGFDTFLDKPSFLLADTNSAPGSLLMILLHTTAADYLSRVDRGEEKTDRLLRTVHTVDVSEAIVESSVAVTYNYGGVPQTFTWTGMTVDADRRIVGPFGANGDNSKVLPFMKLTGYDGSYMENKVFEYTYGQRAVSTIRILQWSLDQGIPTCYITNSIASACPGFSHSSGIWNAVNNALLQGHIVIIPRQDITVGQWSGTGYIDMDPASGAAGYIISGGISGSVTGAGGTTIDTWSEELSCPLVSCNVINPPNDKVYCADDTELVFHSQLVIQCQGQGASTQPWDIDTGYSTWDLGAGYYTFIVWSGGVSCSSAFKIVEVESLLPDKGMEIDDGDGDSDTKTYVVCVSPTSGDKVTVTATPTPVLSEASLPSCWSLTGGTGSGKLNRTVDLTSPSQTTLVAASGFSEKRTTIIVLKVELVTPAGDPVNTPVDSGDGQNEFTFSSANPGILRMNLKAKVTPSSVANQINIQCLFTVDAIAGSALVWDAANPGGKPTASGDDLLATVTFRGLPANNAAFGGKKVALYFSGQKQDEENYEVFFPKNERNHPSNASNADWPNWMYYWSQIVIPLGSPAPTYKYGNASGYGSFTPGTTEIWLGFNNAGSYNAPYGLANPLTGIDNFAWVVTHESQHYKDWCDLWSNNSTDWFNNHKGKTGPNDDKDGDSIPNKTEDVNLNGLYDTGDLYDWEVYNTPTSGRPASILNDFEDWNCQRHKNAKGDHSKDWGDPGMQHKTKDKYDD